MDYARFRPRLLFKRAIEKTLNFNFDVSLPAGADLFVDFRKYLPNVEPKIVFDVGANVGESAEAYVRHFPESRVFRFEPLLGTFEQRKRNVAGFPNVECFNFGLSSKAGNVHMVYSPTQSNLSSITIPEPGKPTVEVQVETLERFCKERAIARIDFLKIDTEGHDLEVLKGAERLLRSHSIGAVQVESAMSPLNKTHVDFQAFRDYLEPKRYYLFMLYDQTPESRNGKPNLRRTNPVFISCKLIDENNTKR